MNLQAIAYKSTSAGMTAVHPQATAALITTGPSQTFDPGYSSELNDEFDPNLICRIHPTIIGRICPTPLSDFHPVSAIERNCLDQIRTTTPGHAGDLQKLRKFINRITIDGATHIRFESTND